MNASEKYRPAQRETWALLGLSIGTGSDRQMAFACNGCGYSKWASPGETFGPMHAALEEVMAHVRGCEKSAPDGGKAPTEVPLAESNCSAVMIKKPGEYYVLTGGPWTDEQAKAWREERLSEEVGG
jgi:hypothetical protein